jgi:hypothetical protein
MNTVATPIETWNDAAAAAVGKIMDFPKQPPAIILAELRLAFTYLEESFSRNQDSGVLSLHWAGVGRIAYRYAANTGNGFTPQELIDTLVRKQRDYGHNNILRFGTFGVIVRCHDKIARLEHLTLKDAEPQNESMKDNMLDVAGYAAIGIMLNHGWFEKELE